MPRETDYEDRPWDDDPEIGAVVHGVLPPADHIKDGVFLVTTGEHQFFSFPKQDMQALAAIAKRQGNSPAELLATIVHQYVQTNQTTP